MSTAQILIVEDEKITARRLQRELEGMGYSVPAVAATGEEALRRAAETTPDLVLMDVVLHGDLDGIETTKRIHERCHVPVVYLSSSEDERTLERARETEPYGYLIKPYQEKELRATIEMALYKHRVEQCLRDTERWLTATLRSVTDAVVATDVVQRVGFMNPVAEQLTGWRAADAIEHELSQVLRLEGERAADSLAPIEARAGTSEETVHFPPRTQLVSRGGRRVPVEGAVSPIRDEGGQCTGYVWVFRDVGERLRAEERLRLASEEFQRARQREAVSNLAGDIAHDFNNLLTVVLGNASLVLCQLSENDPNLRALLNIESAALGAMDLVRRLQGYSRLTNPKQGPADLNVAVQRVWDGLRRLIDLSVVMDFRPTADLWPVGADPAALEELLTNLCVNVCNAMPRGGRLVVETENVALTDDDLRGRGSRQAGEFARVRVCDPADGLAPLMRFRGSGPAGATIPGLQEVFESVEQFGGWTEFESDPRRGAVLDVYLPRAPVPPPGDPAEVAPPPARRHRATVLLVDDEPMVRELSRTVLTRHGYQVLLADDGSEAVEIYRDKYRGIDLVILDLTMPSLSGDDTFRQMLRINPEARVLFCSGYPSDHIKSLSYPQVVGFVNKPFRNEELLNAVRSALD